MPNEQDETAAPPRYRLLLGDCLERMAELPDASVDSCVTDPPAGISFMGREWDGDKGGRDAWIAWMQAVAAEVLRVLKPGGHALVWALPRTSHWTATAWENAGFEVRDRVSHLFGQGFPKSHNLKGDFAGWGTALKPACEDWWLLRKPFKGSVAENVARHGTGAINVDGCRVPADSRPLRIHPEDAERFDGTFESGFVKGCRAAGQTDLGRWPANVCHDGSDEVLAAFAAFGEKDGGGPARRPTGFYSRDYDDSDRVAYGKGIGVCGAKPAYQDAGTAARFFYCAKPSKAERNAGLDDIPPGLSRRNGAKGQGPLPQQTPCDGVVERNTHPTVKSVALMRYLCRLVTPPGGTVLDPFLGSGSTGVAAMQEGFRFIGIERDDGYFRIAQERIQKAACDSGLFAL
jgi:site-specific DNA-methyltransferase (adenine-specific)